MQLVFEIGCEELPPSFCEPALEQMEAAFRERAEELRLDFGTLRTVATPRRLTVLVDDLVERQSDLKEERTGPPAAVAFDDGEPTDAARGFARGQGVTVDDLYTVDTDRGEYVAAEVFEEGEETSALLPGILGEVIESLRFPKSMRWADRSERFARPVRWLLAVAGGETIPVEFAGVESGNQTFGHRFAAPESFEVSGIDDYLDALEEAHVIADQERRRATIVEDLEAIASDVGGVLVADPELVDEVAFLIEEPHAIAISFGDDYLELPDEVLISSMRSHQRYFAIADEESGALKSMCGIIYNTPVHTPKEVYEGNLRVLRARLDDARFFWEKDLATPLEDRLEGLKEVVWLQQIGSLRDRCERMARLAEALGDVLELDEATRKAARRAALLSKTDLLTEMVDEFPDLQGVMGREYALADGEDREVAYAIEEQYRPEGADDRVPETTAGSIVALAEKLDALVGCFGVDLVPTASSDPYGLRRAALGVIRILEESGLDVRLERLFELGVDAYEALAYEALEKDGEELVDELLDFTATRLKYDLVDDYPTDVVDAVLAVERGDVLGVKERVDALAELRGEADFEPLADGFKRVVNILEKESDRQAAQVDEELLVEDEERALAEASAEAADEVDHALTEGDWPRACRALIALKEPVDAFFDNVMVMADDEDLRRNRLALLESLRHLFLKVADISVIQA